MKLVFSDIHHHLSLNSYFVKKKKKSELNQNKKKVIAIGHYFNFIHILEEQEGLCLNQQ